MFKVNPLESENKVHDIKEIKKLFISGPNTKGEGDGRDKLA